MRKITRRSFLPYAAMAAVAFATWGIFAQSGGTLPLQSLKAQVQQGQPPSEREQPNSETRSQRTQSHTGIFARAGDGQFTMTSDGQEHRHSVSSDARITLNGKPAQLDDLRRGDTLRVTTAGNAVVAIEARRGRQTETAPERADANRGRTRRPAQPSNDQTAWLGVMLEESRGGGVLVTDVFPEGPADRAGIRPNDYLTKIGGQEVNSVDDVVRLIDASKPSTEVPVLVFRDGQEQTLTATLGTRHETAFYGRDDAERDDEVDGMSREPACEECVMRLAEQHERLEEQIRQLVQEVQALRQQVAELQGRPLQGAAPQKPVGDNQQKSPQRGGAAEQSPQPPRPEE